MDFDFKSLRWERSPDGKVQSHTLSRRTTFKTALGLLWCSLRYKTTKLSVYEGYQTWSEGKQSPTSD